MNIDASTDASADASVDASVDTNVDTSVDANEELGPPVGFVPYDGCGTVPLVYDGELCGGGNGACVIMREERLAEPTQNVRNRRPGIAVGPSGRVHLSFSENIEGFYATAEPGEGFSVVPTGVRTAVSVLVVDDDEEPILVSSDGATNLLIHKRQTSGGWEQLASLADAKVANHGVVRDTMGCIHGPGSSYSEARTNVYTWSGAEFSQTQAGRPTHNAPTSAFGIGPDGTPHLAWGESILPNVTFDLLWANGSEVAVVDAGLAWRGGIMHFEMGVDASSMPHFLYGYGGAQDSIFYASRGPDGAFVTTELDSSSFEGCNPWTTEASQGAPACSYVVDVFSPVTVFASAGGDVRVAYLKMEEQASLEVECIQFPPEQSCSWVGERMRSTSIVLATVSATGVEREVLASSLQGARARATLASDGTMHFALYERTPEGDTVQYLQVGPAEL